MTVKLYIIEPESITPINWGSELAEKPTLEEVLKYAKGNIMKFISQIAGDVPPEQKEEIEQSVYLRLCQAYSHIDADRGWKSFVFNHCRGGVFDYVKFGKGFEEAKWSLQKAEEHGAQNTHKIKTRITELPGKPDGASDEDCSIEQILERLNISSELDSREVVINWTLVSHMSAQDEIIHVFAKYLLGFSVDEIAIHFNKCRARVSQMVQAFVDRLDDPELSDDVWQKQTIYAFGLCRRFNLPEVDQSTIYGFPIGWTTRKIDLYSKEPIHVIPEQLDMFDAG